MENFLNFLAKLNRKTERERDGEREREGERRREGERAGKGKGADDNGAARRGAARSGLFFLPFASSYDSSHGSFVETQRHVMSG